MVFEHSHLISRHRQMRENILKFEAFDRQKHAEQEERRKMEERLMRYYKNTIKPKLKQAAQ